MNYHLNKKEYAIMCFLWEHSENGVFFGDIRDFADQLAGKKETRQSVNNYIKSLNTKGMITTSGEEGRRLYFPKVSKKEYDLNISNEILKEFFGGSIRNFVSALNGGETLTEEQAAELRKILRNSRNRQ